MIQSKKILGYDVVSATVGAVAAEIEEVVFAGQSSPRWLACLNPHSYAVAEEDEEFSSALRGADWLVPDGVGLVLASVLVKRPLLGRITGPDVFAALMRRLHNHGTASVFFLGGSEENLARIKERVAREFPGVRQVGSYSPPYREVFSSDEVDAMVSAVNSAAPDVLWVSLTAPKQEKWIAKHAHRLNVRFIGAVGAALDFFTGAVRPPPTVVQRAGLGWLFRFMQEPRRLFQRNFVSTPIFVLAVCRSALVVAAAENSRGD